MLENFGMHDQAKAKKRLTEDINRQWENAMARTDAFKGKAAQAVDTVRDMDSSLSSLAGAFNASNSAAEIKAGRDKVTDKIRLQIKITNKDYN